MNDLPLMLKSLKQMTMDADEISYLRPVKELNSQINMRLDHKAEHPWNKEPCKERFLNAQCDYGTD